MRKPAPKGTKGGSKLERVAGKEGTPRPAATWNGRVIRHGWQGARKKKGARSLETPTAAEDWGDSAPCKGRCLLVLRVNRPGHRQGLSVTTTQMEERGQSADSTGQASANGYMRHQLLKKQTAWGATGSPKKKALIAQLTVTGLLTGYKEKRSFIKRIRNLQNERCIGEAISESPKRLRPAALVPQQEG